MRKMKFALLATIAASTIATAAQAQIATPAPGPNDTDASLHGAGATSIQNVLVQVQNCIGADQQLGASGGATGSLTTISPGNYTPTPASSTNPAFNCATKNLQPNFSAKYVGTGSGFGRQAWRLYNDQWHPTTAGVHNPFNEVSGNARWSHVQYAFSDTIISPSDLTAYNTNANSTTNRAGPAVQFPLFILPVAIAYNPVYGKLANGTELRFNVHTPQSINGVVSGGLPLTRELYCGIFNGEIKNFNDARFAAANGGYNLADRVNDTGADKGVRWKRDGVPIRLVGRLDRSGTTDVFSRHLAAVCTGLVTTNKYQRNAESLPYNPASGVNLANVRADTGYSTGNNAGGNYPNAGSTNMVSGDYFNGTAIVYNGAGPSSAPTAGVGSGLYITADGSGRVRDAINLDPDFTLNGVKLNGKIGYIGSDFIANAVTSKPLMAAALQVNGTGSTYLMPSAANGQKAFGDAATGTQLLPPQADASGNWVLNGDTRQVRNAAGAMVNATRDNPIAWTDVLYSSTNNNLAAPVVGYAITGTTQFFGYTCYKTNNRYNVIVLLASILGKYTKDSTGAAFSATTFSGTASNSLGIIAQANIGVVPTPWVAALANTFLSKSTQTNGGQALATYGNGGKGLWIQDKLQLTALTANSNTSCTANVGS